MSIELNAIIGEFLEGSIATKPAEPVIESISITENGTYTAPTGVDGYNPITVNVPDVPPVLTSLTATENNTYLPPQGYDGFNEVTVNVTPPLETKNITANGTYTPSSGYYGFNEVNVNVPLPDNGYLLNTGSGASVSYINGVVLNLQDLEVNIEPVQSGSGDPSPTNIRPISGRTECNITVADAAVDPVTSNTYEIVFTSGGASLTVYGGTLNVTSGVLTVDMITADLGSFTWVKETWGSGIDFYTSLNDAKRPSDDNTKANIISSQYKNLTRNEIYNSSDDGISLLRGGSLKIRDSRYSEGDATAFKTAMNGVQLVYELATPQVIQLTPTQIETLLGNNVITADTGAINNIEYFTK